MALLSLHCSLEAMGDIPGYRVAMFRAGRGRWRAVLAIGCVSSLSLLVGQANSAGGSTTSSRLSAIPADGRLRAQDFAATVTSVAWPNQASVTGRSVQAPPGHRFVMFTLSLSENAASITPVATPPVSAKVTWNQDSVPLSLTAIDDQIRQSGAGSGWPSGTAPFTVVVSNTTHDVDLVVSDGSFSQSFDLWSLRRAPPVPVVLYRDPSTPTLSGTATAPATLALSNPSDGFSSSASVTLQNAALGYFAPNGTASAPLSPNQGVLSVVLDGQFPNDPNDPAGSGHYLGSQAPLPDSMLSFTPAGGTPVAATMSDAGDTAGKGTSDDGLFDATYSFVVPATLTTGTLNINTNTFTGTEFTLFTAESGNTTLDVTAPASLTLGFPAVPTAAVQKTPPWVGQPLPPTTTASASASTRDSSSGHGLPILVVVLVLLFLTAGVVLFQRSRRRRSFPAPAGTAPVAPRAPAHNVEETETTNAEPPRITVAPIPPTAAQTPQPVAGTVLVERPPGPMVLVLGPPAGRGLRQEPDRRIVIEILAWMVFHNEHPHSADEILVGVYPTEGTREVNRETFFTYLSKVRQCVGADHLPEATGAGGYRLIGVVSDWALFKELSDRAGATGGTEAIDLRTEALSLVRGVPFQGVPTGRYQWAFEEHLHTMTTSAVVTCAIRLVNDLFDLGRYDDVENAAKAGLRADARNPHLLALQDRAAEARNEGLVLPGREIGDAEAGGHDAGDNPAEPGR
jgi:hypothetical protein